MARALCMPTRMSLDMQTRTRTRAPTTQAMDICITAVEKYPNDMEKCTQVGGGAVACCRRTLWAELP